MLHWNKSGYSPHIRSGERPPTRAWRKQDWTANGHWRTRGERYDSTHRLLLAQESERLRVAHELHDEVGQALTGIMLALARLAHDAPPSIAHPLAQLLESTRASADDVRRIVMRLRPGPLESLGLSGALTTLTQSMREQTGMAIDCDIASGIPSAQSPQHELVVYRVAQEAMTNAARHARAKSISVELRFEHGRLTLNVKDDGCGLGPDHREGHGMRGMRERAEMVGGTLRIEDGRDGDTQVRLEIPTAKRMR